MREHIKGGGAILRLLGDFRLLEGDRDRTPPPGLPAQLLKIAAITDGRWHWESIADALWPGVSPERAGVRLRNVLARLRDQSGDLVRRHGQTLLLAPQVQVDALHFDDEAGRALQSATGDRRRALSLARSAVSRYQGELLPEDGHAFWVSALQERLRRRFLACIDLLVDDAEQRGAADEALVLLERAIEVEPLDEARSVRAARLLSAQGHRGSALRLLERAVAAAEEVGMTPAPEVLELREELSEARRRRPGGGASGAAADIEHH